MAKPKLLDLFCCAGGATKGYQLAGFEVTGVDIERRPCYVGDSFVQADAVSFAQKYAQEFDFIHASPPCQRYSTITLNTAKETHPDLVYTIREVLIGVGVPYVIENVVGAVKAAGLRKDLLLCGEMFGLRVVRHRVFELGFCSVPQPDHVAHRGRVKGSGRASRGTYSKEGYYFAVYGQGTDKGTTDEWREAMGIDWMTDRHDLAEAIPLQIQNILELS